MLETQPATYLTRNETINHLTLKWGTVKAWKLNTPEARAAFQKWSYGGVSMSAMTQNDTPEQKQAICDLINLCDDIWLDWNGKQVSREEAKNYILNYGKQK